MNSEFLGKLSTRLFAPVIIIFVVVLIVLFSYIPGLTEKHAISSAITSAEGTVKQYKTIRGYYTKNIIKKIKAGTEFKPHYNHKGEQMFYHSLQLLFTISVKNFLKKA